MHIDCLVLHRFVTTVEAILVDATTQLKFERRVAQKSRKCSGGLVVMETGCYNLDAGVLFPLGHIFLILHSVGTRYMCLPDVILCAYRELSPRVESPELETDHSAPSAAEVRILWFCIVHQLPAVFIACSEIRHTIS
jgi:hypothetical protein